MQRFFSFTVLLLLISSCSNRLDVGDFNEAAWKADLNGCNAKRINLLDELNELKPKLLGLHHKSIIKVLGSPEEQELYKRSQTYYFYYIDAGPKCDQPTENPRRLEIRYTALGIANEVNIR